MQTTLRAVDGPWAALAPFGRGDDSWLTWPGASLDFQRRPKAEVVAGEIRCTAWPVHREAYSRLKALGGIRRGGSLCLPLDTDRRALALALGVGQYLVHRSVVAWAGGEER